jgi:UPF0755 protein
MMRSTKTVMKSTALIMGFAVLLVAGSVFFVWQRYTVFLDTPMNLPAAGFTLQIEPGTSGQSIVYQLAREDITAPGWQWKLLMRLEPVVIKAGEFHLEPPLNPSGLLDILSSGRVVQYRFTIVEGWTFLQLVETLMQNEVLDQDWEPGPLEDATNAAGFLGLDHPEGWFMPETYQFTRGDSVQDILIRAHNLMLQALQSAWQARSLDNPLQSPYELLTLASIIEKETALDQERIEIAGVFARRLKSGMRLQTDPTVIYGLGASFDGNIRREDLKTDAPYNTYTRPGLPPTPIALPGRSSLQAAAQPADGSALYFVADGAGGHTFSVTLEEHQEAVKKMIGKK